MFAAPVLRLVAIATCFWLLTTDRYACGDVRDDIRAVHGKFASDVARAKEAYAEKVASEASLAIKQYERLAARAVREGDLAAATTAWREILRLDRNHSEARRFFTSIGRLDQELKEMESDKPPVSPENMASNGPASTANALVGTRWNYEGGRMLTLNPNGEATIGTTVRDSEKRFWTTDPQGRVLLVSPDGTQISLLTFTSGNSYSAANYTKQSEFGGNR
jgi:hypothetical protein